MKGPEDTTKVLPRPDATTCYCNTRTQGGSTGSRIFFFFKPGKQSGTRASGHRPFEIYLYCPVLRSFFFFFEIDTVNIILRLQELGRPVRLCEIKNLRTLRVQCLNVYAPIQKHPVGPRLARNESTLLCSQGRQTGPCGSTKFTAPQGLLRWHVGPTLHFILRVTDVT